VNWAARSVAWLFGGPKVGGALEARLAHWMRLPPADLLPHGKARYVVVDVETSGLHLARDSVIAIGAVAVDELAIDLDDCFEIVLRQEKASADANVLIHGIGGQRQRSGADPAEGLVEFLEYVGDSTLVAFRAEFDQTMLERAVRETLGPELRRPFVDLAWVLPALFPGKECRSLEDWLALFGIPPEERHQALGDAFATAQLLQVSLHAAMRFGMTNARALMRMQKAQRWLGKKG
jgi:DNA polymerase III subunit epsilon